jgi:hypothetical protein
MIFDYRNVITHGGLPHRFSLTLDDLEAIADERGD